MHRSEQRSGTSPPPTTSVTPPLPSSSPPTPPSDNPSAGIAVPAAVLLPSISVPSSASAPSSLLTPPGGSSAGCPPLHPHPPTPDEKHEEALPRYKRDLVAKIKILRTELQTMQPQSGHCRLEVSRAEIFEVILNFL